MSRLIDREWRQTFARYMEVSRRDQADVINTKLLFVARRALLETPKADRAKLQALLGPVATELTHQKIRILKDGTIKRGRLQGRNVWAKAKGRSIERLALIINARRRKEGQDPLHGKALEKEMLKVWRARLRSISFLKSGWIPAIKKLEPLAINRSGIARRDSTAKQIGKPKGRAISARASFLFRPKGMIENSANAKNDHKAALLKYGQPALDAAVRYEMASMDEYLAKKMAASARRLGIRASGG